MRIGLQIPSFTWPGGAGEIGSRLANIAKTADDAGFYSLWVMDHFFQIEYIGPADEPMLEGYAALNFMAGVTRRAKLGTLVTGVTYRHPGILVKTVSSLDVLSGGRAYLGIGAAWNERESVGLGVPFPPLKERFERLEETLQIAHQMWAGRREPYQGQYYHLTELINSPQPVSQPHPPILVGGMGETKTLRLVAQYADACNFFAAFGPDALRQKLDVLKGHCDAVGRPYEAIEKTALDTVHLAAEGKTPAQVIESCHALAGLGIQHVIFNMPNVHEITPLETFGREIIPAVAEF
ncbi:MAG: LLM class F420-dependent oxidoreductase [Anaerolineae bacterium]|nr:LLM class F420-dependent oxidoreductase [Anaerolineales bacterium]MCQ3975962.1 LLM class F420-dependent oxidoreductase [Anaerolineae bacterium]